MSMFKKNTKKVNTKNYSMKKRRKKKRKNFNGARTHERNRQHPYIRKEKQTHL